MESRRFFCLLTAVVLLSLVVGSFHVQAQSLSPASSRLNPMPGLPIIPQNSSKDPSTPQLGADGLWFMEIDPSKDQSDSSGKPLQTNGGPDNFGYTWNDVPLNWQSAGSGIDSGINSTMDHTGPIDLGFSFKYYENTYSQLYISFYGFVSFNNDSLSRVQSTIPNAEKPNDVIAPHWVPAFDIQGYIRYLRGGTAPNRWFIVEWNQLVSEDDKYTFEVLLYENGDIAFQYGSMLIQSGYACQSSGIEDSTGLDGLTITPFCAPISTNHAVHIYRPAPSARVGIRDPYMGNLVSPGSISNFEIPIRNIGELGVDTYDLTVSSAWPLTLFTADGVTELIDNDGDGMQDSGPVLQGASTSIFAKIQVPVGATVGASITAIVTACSSVNPSICKTVKVQLAIPTSFAQLYKDNNDNELSLYLAQPGGQALKKISGSSGNWWGNDPAISEMPNGNFAYVAREGSYCSDYNCSIYFNNLVYSISTKYGEPIRAATLLTNNSNANTITLDYEPAIAVTPDGHVGILWYRYLYQYINNTYVYNYNIFFAILDPSGNVVFGPTSLTNNSNWGQYYEYYHPTFYSPRISATGSNQFVVAWIKSYYIPPVGSCTGNCSVADVYYAIKSSNGSDIRSISQLTHATGEGYDGNNTPNLTALSGSHTLITWSHQQDIYYAVLDNSGAVSKETTPLVSDSYSLYDSRPDAVQLSNGRIIIAWTSAYFVNNPYLRFAILDSSYNLVVGPIELDNSASKTGDNYVSIAADEAGRAVLTWMDNSNYNRENLYYALVSHTGEVLTQPMIFQTSQSSSPLIFTSPAGYGNTSYTSISPGVDASLGVNNLSGGKPGGSAQVIIHITNQGQQVASGVELTATLDSNLSYLSDSSGISPIIENNHLTWHFPDLHFLDDNNFILSLKIPDTASIGTRFAVSLAVSTNENDINPENNSAQFEVMAALQTFLPAVKR